MELIVRVGEREERVQVRPAAGARLYEVLVGERLYQVDRSETGRGLRSLVIAGAQHEVAVRADGNGGWAVSVDGVLRQVDVADPLTHLARQAQAGQARPRADEVTAYMPGRVVAVLVAEGEQVATGQGILVLEAMKMQNEIQAQHAGLVKRLHVTPGQTVEKGEALFEIG